MRRIRELQDETRGFRAFISWTFQHDGNRLGDDVPRRGPADLVRLPAHAGRVADLPRQRRPHPELVGDAGTEDRPGRARLRRRRHGLGDDRGERRLGRRHDPPDVDGGARAPDPLAREDSRCSGTRSTATSRSSPARAWRVADRTVVERRASLDRSYLRLGRPVQWRRRRLRPKTRSASADNALTGSVALVGVDADAAASSRENRLSRRVPAWPTSMYVAPVRRRQRRPRRLELRRRAPPSSGALLR